MTTTQAVHLIEQFAAQAPFAVWITDSRGVSIFANRKLHELLKIPEHPSGALGFNLFDDPSLESLGIGDIAFKARAGENIDTIIDIPHPEDIQTQIPSGVKDPITIRITCYALRSSAQKIEHYVVLINDVTETSRRREELKTQLRDLAIYNTSREARLARMHELEADIEGLEKEIKRRGAEPAA